MTDSGPVFVRAGLGKESMALIRQMIWASVSEALTIAAQRIEELERSDASQVPIKTGALRRSFKIGISPGQLFLHWSALSPKGFDYARIQDIGGLTGTGGWIRPKYYSQVMKDQAKQIVYEELRAALERNKP